MNVLGLESSCDETAAAVVVDGRRVLSSVVASQGDLHERFGGVVPEIASRAHVENLVPVTRSALEQAGLELAMIDGIAVVNSPGLLGSLLVGLSGAKGLAWALDKPLVAVDHVEAHVYAAFLGDPPPDLPCAALVASGGHTSLFVMRGPTEFELVARTRDDAAGEAFDKAASMLNLGFPGGPAVEKVASRGRLGQYAFPTTTLKDGSLDFSFSGVKTSLLYLLYGQDGSRDGPLKIPPDDLPDVLAAYQEAITEVLVDKLVRLALGRGLPCVIAGGGVCANGRFRAKLVERTERHGLRLCLAPRSCCTDNAAMVAGLGYHLLRQGRRSELDIDALARSPRAGSRK